MRALHIYLKRSHEKALKRIGRYLIGTRTKEMIMKPPAELSIDCYVDSDFAGFWSYETTKIQLVFVVVLGF